MRLWLAGDRAALKTAFQPLLRQFRQGLLGLAHQYLLVKLGRLGGVVVAIELDVAKQQRHESPPAQNRSLSFWILRLIHQLFQQPAGQAMGLGVVAQAVGPLGVLVLLLEIAVHALRAVAPVVSLISCRGGRHCPERCAAPGPPSRSRRERPAGLPHRPVRPPRSWCGSRWWRSRRC